MEKLTQSQERAVDAIERQMHMAKPMMVMIGKELRRICLQEPRSARRVLRRMNEGVSLQEAARVLRARGRSDAVKCYELEGILRELYGLDEPAEREEATV